MEKIIILALIAVGVFSANGACKIEVSSTPGLPAKNLLKNSKFEQGMKHWKLFGTAKGEMGVDEEIGLKYIQLLGNETKSNEVIQRVYLNEPLPAGSTIFMSTKTNFIDTDIEMSKPGLSLNAYYTDHSKSYLKTPAVPFEPHQWTISSGSVTVKKTINAFSFSAYYEKQTGKSRWSDFVLKVGNVKLSVVVSDEKLNQIKIYSALKGIIFDSGKLPAGTTYFNKNIEVGVGCGYYVEVTDTNGKIYGKRYPENANAPLPSTVNSLSVFSRFNEEKIMPLKKDFFTFELPATKNKKVFLRLKARLESPVRQVAGYTSAMSLYLNGKKITSKMITGGRKESFTRVDGHKKKIFNSGAFVIFYSPWYFGLSEDNNYCPIDIPSHNPFDFKFDVTDFVKDGENTIEIKNIDKQAPLWCTACRIELKDK
jgi:hypothetical protein